MFIKILEVLGHTLIRTTKKSLSKLTLNEKSANWSSGM
jgi:hypothetical protein